MGVHSVDLDGEINEYALLAAAIHAMLLVFKGTSVQW
jgi:hypothetical protein